jgi:exopolysaccharide production protein ExoZ
VTPIAPPAASSKPIYYPGIQDLRGWAALCVLLHHTHILFQKDKYFGTNIFWGFFEFGHRGVDLFFVISGFLMAMLTHEPTQKNQPVRFLLARARRIYIPYLPVLAVLSSACLLAKNICPAAYVVDATMMLMNISIVPREDLNTFVPVVAWTLSHEIFFYVMTFVSLLFLGRGRVVFFTWLAASTVISLAGIELPFPWSFVFSPYNMAFGLGFLAFKLNHTYRDHIPARTCLWMGAVGFITLGCIESFWGQPVGHFANLYFTATFFVASFLLVLGFLSRPASWIRPLGNASYSIYLVHYPLLVVLCALAKRFLGGALPTTPLFVLLAVIALAGGGLYYLMIERPGLRLFGRRLDS